MVFCLYQITHNGEGEEICGSNNPSVNTLTWLSLTVMSLFSQTGMQLNKHFVATGEFHQHIYFDMWQQGKSPELHLWVMFVIYSQKRPWNCVFVCTENIVRLLFLKKNHDLHGEIVTVFFGGHFLPPKK